ncbi:TPA: hypothetical protein ACH3X2_002183 [Trebouxia sp. C0005]
MASSSAPGSKLAELEEELKGLKAQKTAELRISKGTRDHELLAELNKDLDRVQAAITALSSGPPTPPPSYDRVMTAILQELKFLHMQSASQGLPWTKMVSLFGVLLAAALLIVPTCLWYAKAQTSFVQWGTITTSTMNTVQLVLLLLLAKDNPLWLPIVVLGREQVARVLELYGYEITRHIPVGDVLVNEGDMYGDSPQQV